MPGDLQSVVERMVAAGEPEENIRLVIEHYGPQLKADPGPMIGARHEDTRDPSGTLMDLIPPPSQRRADMHAYEQSLPLAVPGVIGDVRKVPGIIAQAARLPATKEIAKKAGKEALKIAAQGALGGTAYAMWRKIFD